VAPTQLVSAQSVLASQSLSLLSLQISVAGTTYDFPVQVPQLPDVQVWTPLLHSPISVPQDLVIPGGEH